MDIRAASALGPLWRVLRGTFVCGFSLSSLLLGGYLGVESLAGTADLRVTCEEPPHCLPKAAAPFSDPTGRKAGFRFLTPSPALAV